MRTSSGDRTHTKQIMYLIDTHVMSEARKRAKANRGVRQFFRQVIKERTSVFLSVITVGELRRGIELLRHRGDRRQAGAVGGVVRSAAERSTEILYWISIQTLRSCGAA